MLARTLFPTVIATGAACVVVCMLGVIGCGDPVATPPVASDSQPPPGVPSEKSYTVRYVPGVTITIDGEVDEPAWQQAVREDGFAFPWKAAAAPATEFRALCDADNLYFMFRVEDADIVVLENLRDKQDIVLEDRVELFFARDDGMQDYYCLEIDPRGRTYDYQAVFYRKFNASWSCRGLKTQASLFPGGYVVEGSLPLATLADLGFPLRRPGNKIRVGLYRAEFSHDSSGRPAESGQSPHTLGRASAGPPPLEEWISWVDPQTPKPDFHLPASLGWLEIVDGVQNSPATKGM